MAQKPDERRRLKLTVNLPYEFGREFQKYVAERGRVNIGINPVTTRVVVYEALREYMRRHPAQKG